MISQKNQEIILEYLRGLHFVGEPDIIRNGSIRFPTLFMYPDGDFVDVFVDLDTGLLTDYGHTTDWLFHLCVEVDRPRLVVDSFRAICERFKIVTDGHAMTVDINPLDLTDLCEGIFRLAQACICATELRLLAEANTTQTQNTSRAPAERDANANAANGYKQREG